MERGHRHLHRPKIRLVWNLKTDEEEKVEEEINRSRKN
jgi:hypothetical protein